MIELIITVVLQLAGYFLGKSKDSKEMQELFYKFVERIHTEYLNSAKMRDNAKARMKAIEAKPFVESP